MPDKTRLNYILLMPTCQTRVFLRVSLKTLFFRNAVI